MSQMKSARPRMAPRPPRRRSSRSDRVEPRRPDRSVSAFVEYLRGAHPLDDDALALDDEIASRGQRPVSFGTLAYLMGYLELDHVRQVLDEQAKSRRRIGATAVDLGFMTDAQVQAVIDVQCGPITFADVVIAVRVLERGKVGELLHRFRQLHGPEGDRERYDS